MILQQLQQIKSEAKNNLEDSEAMELILQLTESIISKLDSNQN